MGGHFTYEGLIHVQLLVLSNVYLLSEIQITEDYCNLH